MSGGARQIVLALSGIRWAGLFVLAYATLRLRSGLRWLVTVVAIEIALGMTGFFADFKAGALRPRAARRSQRTAG